MYHIKFKWESMPFMWEKKAASFFKTADGAARLKGDTMQTQVSLKLIKAYIDASLLRDRNSFKLFHSVLKIKSTTSSGTGNYKYKGYVIIILYICPDWPNIDLHRSNDLIGVIWAQTLFWVCDVITSVKAAALGVWSFPFLWRWAKILADVISNV